MLYRSALMLTAVTLATAGCDPFTPVIELPGGSGDDITVPATTIDVDVPAGGLWLAGTTEEVTWDPSLAGDQVELYVVDASGNPAFSTGPIDNDGTHAWTSPLDAGLGNDMTLWVVDVAEPTLGGVSEPFTHGSIVGFLWNGSEEEMVRVSPETGETVLHGIVGDLAWWSPMARQVVVEPDGDRLYVPGTTIDQSDHVWVMDKWTGELIDELPGADLAGAEMTSDGTVIACRWNGTAEEVFTYDPATQTSTVIGQVGDLQTWSSQTAINRELGHYIVVGYDSSNAPIVWTVDATSGELLSSAALADSHIHALTEGPDASLLYVRWTGSSEVLESLDPSTGVATTLGTVGDLMWIHNGGAVVYNPASQQAYVWGANAQDEARLWVMDLATGDVVADVPQAHILSELHLVH